MEPEFTTTIDQQRLASFFERFPFLFSVLETLQKNSILWMIGGSGCLYLLGNDRLPEDVDILLPDNLHDTVDKLFGIDSFTYTSAVEEVRNSNPGGNHDIQFTSHLKLHIQEQDFSFNYNEDIFSHRISGHFKELDIFLLPPEEVLLIKALLQRGEAEGKHDIADIQAFRTKYLELDLAYIDKRIAQLKAEARIGTIFLSDATQ